MDLGKNFSDCIDKSGLRRGDDEERERPNAATPRLRGPTGKSAVIGKAPGVKTYHAPRALRHGPLPGPLQPPHPDTSPASIDTPPARPSSTSDHLHDSFTAITAPLLSWYLVL